MSRAAPKRDSIPLQSVKDIMIASSGVENCRLGVSEKTKAGKRPSAAGEARAAVKTLLREIAAECQAACAVAKRSTVNMAILEHVVSRYACKGVKLEDVHVEKQKGVRMDLPVAGVRRVFLGKEDKGKKSKGGLRVSATVEMGLTGLAIAYLRRLGRLAGTYAKAAKLQTVQAGHVNAARKALAGSE